MLPRRQKLSRKSFPAFNAPKTTWRGVSLVVRFSLSKSEELPRFAVVISKKTHNLASKRNKIRRTIYQCIRDHKVEFSRHMGAKFVITLQKSTQTISNELIQSDIKAFLKK